MTQRYFIYSEHIRGERRIYWVEDRHKKYGRGFAQASGHTTDKRKAQRWCDDLNEIFQPGKRLMRGQEAQGSCDD